MNSLNRICIFFVTFIFICQPTLAVLDIDMSVDSDIRKKYNPQKIEDDLLPPLPDKLKNEVKKKSSENNNTKTIQSNSSTTNSTVTTKPTYSTSKTSLQQAQKTKSLGQSITLKKGTKLNVRSCEKLYDEIRIGKKVYFKLSKSIKTNSFYMPENTKFIASVVDAHPPQITGNGGLIVLKIEQVIINGKNQYINAKITKSNHKNIFFNNIKGKRSYIANTTKNTTPGKNFYKNMLKKSKKYAKKKTTMILTPITYICGVAVYGVNIIGSPIFAIFSHGKTITIPANTQFEIQLLEDTTLYN